jgi:hypothetical protein
LLDEFVTYCFFKSRFKVALTVGILYWLAGCSEPFRHWLIDPHKAQQGLKRSLEQPDNKKTLSLQHIFSELSALTDQP